MVFENRSVAYCGMATGAQKIGADDRRVQFVAVYKTLTTESLQAALHNIATDAIMAWHSALDRLDEPRG